MGYKDKRPTRYCPSAHMASLPLLLVLDHCASGKRARVCCVILLNADLHFSIKQKAASSKMSVAPQVCACLI